LTYSVIGVLGYMMFAKPRIVSVTDRAVVVMATSTGGGKPTKAITRLPRETRLGDVKGLWGKLRLGNEMMYVHRKFHTDVKAAYSALSA